MTLSRSYALLFIPLLFASCSLRENPVTKDEALKLAHRIEYSAAHRDNALLNNIFDEKELARRISKEGGLLMSSALVKGAVEGFQQGQFGKAIIDALGKDGSYELIKYYEKDKKQHILFRLNGEGGVNYHDFELVKSEETVKAADVFIYISGEDLSKTIADALKLADQNIPKEDLDKVEKIKTIKSFMAQGEDQKALDIYDELPDAIKKEKAYQLIHIRLCSKLGNEKYIQALDQYRNLFPNEPNMYLMMIDAYILQKDYPAALGAVNKLDSLIDKDPYQDYQRGLIYLLLKDTLHSEQSFERLHRNMPKYNKGIIELMETYYYTHNDDKAVQLIREAKDSNYLSPQYLDAIYSLHPELKQKIENHDIKGK
jgi:hypothetical protein